MHMQTRSRPTSTVVLGLLLGFSPCFAGPVSAASAASPAGATSGAASALPVSDAQLFAEVMQLVHQDYVTPVNDHQLMLAAIRGMVESLDSHSTFLTNDEFQDMQVTTSGAYAGIGVEVVPGKDGVKVVRRMPGSPAERAGIHAGDVIVRIDDLSVNPTDVDAAIERMRGPDGSVIRLAVRRDGTPQLLQFGIRRAQVKLVSVESERLTPEYGYLRITSFTDSTPGELESAVHRLERTGPHPLKGFVIDLRNNPGGVLDSAVRVADDFLDHGTIVSARGRAEDANFSIAATPGDITHGARLVVVVNGGSASAAEILAAALHDNHRAILIGRRTYGKGTVQTIMPMPYGTALKLTTSRYYTPAGICINGIGIQPDVLLSGPEQPPADLDGAAANAGAAGAGGDPGSTLAQRDPQVAAALQLLRQSTAPLLGRAGH